MSIDRQPGGNERLNQPGAQPNARALRDRQDLEAKHRDFWDNIWTMVAESAGEGNPSATTLKGRGKRQETKGELEMGAQRMRGIGRSEGADSASGAHNMSDAAASSAIAEAQSAIADLRVGTGAKRKLGKIGKDEDFGQIGFIKATEIV